MPILRSDQVICITAYSLTWKLQHLLLIDIWFSWGQIAGYVIAGIRSNVRLRKTCVNCIPLSDEASCTSYVKLSASLTSWCCCNCSILSLLVWVCSVVHRCYAQCIRCLRMNIPAHSMYTVFVMEMGRQLQQNSSTDGQVRMFCTETRFWTCTEFWRRWVSANMACNRQYFGHSAEKPQVRMCTALTWNLALCQYRRAELCTLMAFIRRHPKIVKPCTLRICHSFTFWEYSQPKLQIAWPFSWM